MTVENLGNPGDDAMCAIYVALSDLRQADSATGTEFVQENQSASDEARHEQAVALDRARADQPVSGSGLLSSLGHCLGDFVGDLLHGRVGAAFDDAGHDLGAMWNSPHLWGDLGTGLEDVSIVSAAVSAVASLLGPVGSAVEAIASAANAVATPGAALAKARGSAFAASAEDAEADAADAGNRADALETFAKEVLTDLKDGDAAHESALQALTQAIATNDETHVMAASVRLKG